MDTIRAMEVPSPGSWGCRRIASRRASPPRVDPGVTAIEIVSSDPKLSARPRPTAQINGSSRISGTRLLAAHSGAETHRHLNLFRCNPQREVGTRYMCCMEARTFQSAAAQVEPAKIGLAEVTVGEVDIGDVHAAQIDAAKVAAAQVARFACLTAPVELLAATLAQQQVQGIGSFSWFSAGHGITHRRSGGSLDI